MVRQLFEFIGSVLVVQLVVPSGAPALPVLPFLELVVEHLQNLSSDFHPLLLQGILIPKDVLDAYPEHRGVFQILSFLSESAYVVYRLLLTLPKVILQKKKLLWKLTITSVTLTCESHLFVPDCNLIIESVARSCSIVHFLPLSANCTLIAVLRGIPKPVLP